MSLPLAPGHLVYLILALHPFRGEGGTARSNRLRERRTSFVKAAFDELSTAFFGAKSSVHPRQVRSRDALIYAMLPAAGCHVLKSPKGNGARSFLGTCIGTLRGRNHARAQMPPFFEADMAFANCAEQGYRQGYEYAHAEAVWLLLQ